MGAQSLKNACRQLVLQSVSCIQWTRGAFTAAGTKPPRKATILIARDHSLKWNETVFPDSGFGVLGLAPGMGRASSLTRASVGGVISVFRLTNTVCIAIRVAVVSAATQFKFRCTRRSGERPQGQGLA